MWTRIIKRSRAFLHSAETWLVEKWKAALIIVGIVLVPLIVWKVPEWQARAYHGRLDANAISKLTPQELIQLQKDLITAENNARVTLAQILGGIALLVGLYLTYKNIKVAEEGKLTERFSKAVELLGSDKLDVRLGGIYALERIAWDSQKDHWTVMEVLTAFVREQSRNEHKRWRQLLSNSRQPMDTEPSDENKRLSTDIQAALTVIGRRKWADQESTHQRIDFSNSFLKWADLREAKLQGANFNSTILNDADLRKANLTEARLIGTSLNRAILNKANLVRALLYNADLTEAALDQAKLSGAKLDGARLISAKLVMADLSKTTLWGAKLIKAKLVGADLTDADFYSFFSLDGLSNATDLTGAELWQVKGLTWEQISKAIIDETTKLPPDLEERRKAEQSNEAE